MRTLALPAALALGTALAAAAPAAALTLYDATLGSLPSAQGWSVLALGAPAAQSVAAGVYTLDTAGVDVVIFGNGRLSPLVLDTNAGFDLAFSLQVQGEAHSSTARAGYSVLAVGAQGTHALEVAFWSDHIWVYDHDASQPDPFVHGADIAFDTAASLRTYTLSVRNQQFALSSQGTPLLTGALRDYAPGSAPSPPYSTPNFLFFGDDTSRGSSVTRLGFVSVTEVPEPASVVLLLAGLAAGLVCRTRRPVGS